MPRRTRNRAEDRLVEIERLAALLIRQNAASPSRSTDVVRGEPGESIGSRLRRRFEAYEEEQKRYAAMSVPEKTAAKRKELAALDARPPCMFQSDVLRALQRRDLELDILALEGAPDGEIARLRWEANQTMARRRVKPGDYERAHAPPPRPTPAPAETEDFHVPKEWKPKPPPRDLLRDYRDQRTNRPDGPGSYEPEIV